MAEINKTNLTLNVYNTDGGVVGTHELDARMFGVEPKEGVMHLAVVAHQANGRKVVAHTKQRGEVSGGGKKPWKQKGTGRARHGSSRSPIWRGGGVVFGPRNDRNFSLKINKKAKTKALCMALSQKVAEGSVVLLDTFALKEAKTKLAAATFAKLNLRDPKTKKNPTLAVVFPAGAKEMRRSVRNIDSVEVLGAQSLNIIDVLRAKKIVLPLESISEMVKTYIKE